MASSRVRIVRSTMSPAASGPLIMTLGSAKYRAAARTSPRANALDQFRITRTDPAAAGMPVGRGVGIVCGPELVPPLLPPC
jgi:hypothetical protein